MSSRVGIAGPDKVLNVRPKMAETTGSMDTEKKTNNNSSYREKRDVRGDSITPSLILETILLHGTSLLKYMINDSNLTTYHMFGRKS